MFSCQMPDPDTESTISNTLELGRLGYGQYNYDIGESKPSLQHLSGYYPAREPFHPNPTKLIIFTSLISY